MATEGALAKQDFQKTNNYKHFAEETKTNKNFIKIHFIGMYRHKNDGIVAKNKELIDVTRQITRQEI